MLKELNLNEATLYKNLNSLSEWPDVHFESYKIKRYQKGRQYVFVQRVWWVK